MPSVLRDWVAELPLRAQGTLLTAVRGCDVNPKDPRDGNARTLVAAIRFAFMNPADPREVDSEPGCFMVTRPPRFKHSELGHLPHHWVTHVMHAAEVLGYCHPDAGQRAAWLDVYASFCHGLHVLPETKDMMLLRLTEDRIANGTVVS